MSKPMGELHFLVLAVSCDFVTCYGQLNSMPDFLAISSAATNIMEACQLASVSVWVPE